MSRKRRYADAHAELQPEYHDAQPKPKRPNMSSYPFHPGSHIKVPSSSMVIDPNLELCKSTATSSNADLLLSGSGLGGPTGTPPDYPRQISDLDPLTQDPQLVSTSHHEPELNPPLNSYPEPWNQQFVSGGHLQGLVNRPYPSAWPRMPYSVPRPQGWIYSVSEMDCSASGKYPPDSAYYTKSPASQSMFSGEYHLHSSQQSLNGKMNAMELPSEQIPYIPYTADARLSNDARCSYPEHENSVGLVCKECDTHQVFKNKSEFNKHKLRHEKPFKCDVPSCNRTEGFTTKNDLDRHKKSIHAVHSGKSYMCAALHCPKKNKIWPRADNFRQHIHRLHPECNVQELMDQSWERGCTMAQEGSRRGCNSLELFQQSRYEDDVTTEHDLPYLVTRQEIDNSSTVDSISNPYYPENGYSSATSQESANPYNHASVGVGEPGVLNQEVIDPNSVIHVPDDEYIPEAPEPCPATPKSPLLPSKKKQPLIHRPDDCPDSSAWMEAQVLQTNPGGSQSWAISADVASQAIASDLSKARCRSQEELELVIKDSVLGLLNANKNQKRSPQDSPCREITHPEKRLECNVCHKKKKTQCDLTKHIKRHTRPYGCTFPDCARRFGSKNDWKRHENTMHYQIETWKCAELIFPDGCHRTKAENLTIGTTSGVQCGRLYYRRELFIQHLHEEHDLHSDQHKDYVKDQAKKRRVGRNGQCGFWCGFCQTVVQLEKTETDAWDERFNHIDNEHFKKGDRVDTWVPLAGEVPRRGSGPAEVCDPEKEVREAQDKGSDEEDSGPDAEGEGDVIVLEAGGWEEDMAREKAATAARARGRSNAAGPEGKEKVRKTWNCCKCFNGAELSRDTDLMCYWEGCNHPRCDRCAVSSRVIPEDDYQSMGTASYPA